MACAAYGMPYGEAGVLTRLRPRYGPPSGTGERGAGRRGRLSHAVPEPVMRRSGVPVPALSTRCPGAWGSAAGRGTARPAVRHGRAATPSGGAARSAMRCGRWYVTVGRCHTVAGVAGRWCGRSAAWPGVRCGRLSGRRKWRRLRRSPPPPEPCVHCVDMYFWVGIDDARIGYLEWRGSPRLPCATTSAFCRRPDPGLVVTGIGRSRAPRSHSSMWS